MAVIYSFLAVFWPRKSDSIVYSASTTRMMTFKKFTQVLFMPTGRHKSPTCISRRGQILSFRSNLVQIPPNVQEFILLVTPLLHVTGWAENVDLVDESNQSGELAVHAATANLESERKLIDWWRRPLEQTSIADFQYFWSGWRWPAWIANHARSSGVKWEKQVQVSGTRKGKPD